MKSFVSICLLLASASAAKHQVFQDGRIRHQELATNGYRVTNGYSGSHYNLPEELTKQAASNYYLRSLGKRDAEPTRARSYGHHSVRSAYGGNAYGQSPVYRTSDVKANSRHNGQRQYTRPQNVHDQYQQQAQTSRYGVHTSDRQVSTGDRLNGQARFNQQRYNVNTWKPSYETVNRPQSGGRVHLYNRNSFNAASSGTRNRHASYNGSHYNKGNRFYRQQAPHHY